MLQRSHRRSPAPGQLVLFDPIDTLNPRDAFAPPGTSLTPLHAGDESGQGVQALLSPGLWAALPPAPGPKTVRRALAPSAHQTAQTHTPTFALTTDGALNDAQPSTDGELESIVPPLMEVARLRLPDEPGAQDHVCTPADFVVGAVARFEPNLAALTLLKTLAAAGRPATPEEREVLARFSGFGDSSFEPAFRFSAHRPEDHAWVERGQRLRSLVDDAEWQSIERSRLNAFFTSPDVIAAIWDGLLALGLGSVPAPRILEPAAGVGRFLGLHPTDSAAGSIRTAIELDAVTARLLQALYPRVAVYASGFQDAPLRDDFFDVAISNVPFGDFPVVDRAYLKAGQRFLTRSVHNYFFIKALAKLRPGGVLAFITSRYTLDATTAEPIRSYLHEQADLVAAIRLPAGTFPDTEVVRPQRALRRSPRDGAWHPRRDERHVRCRLHRRAAGRRTRGRHRLACGAHAGAASGSPYARAAQHCHHIRVAPSPCG